MVDKVNYGKLQDDYFLYKIMSGFHIFRSRISNRILGIISGNLCSFMKFTIGLTPISSQERNKQS